MPSVTSAIERAAHNIIALAYFPPAHRGQNLVMGRTITLEQARGIAKFPYVEPRGLPAGYHMIWGTQAPATAARSVLILRYASALNHTGFSVTEMAANPHATSFTCRVLRWRTTSRQPRPPSLTAGYHGKVPPPGFASIPCHGWKAGATQIQLVDESGKLTPTQIQRVIQNTH